MLKKINRNKVYFLRRPLDIHLFAKKCKKYYILQILFTKN